MDVYVYYIVGSTFSTFLGKVAYSYITSNDNDNDNDSDNKLIEDKNINQNDYELINNKGEKEKYWKHLGITFADKSKSIKFICLNECGFEINKKKKNTERSRYLYYLSMYDSLGHDEFVNKFIKKWKLNSNKNNK